MIKKILFPMLFIAPFLLPLLGAQADQNEENFAISIYEPYEEDDDDALRTPRPPVGGCKGDVVVLAYGGLRRGDEGDALRTPRPPLGRPGDGSAPWAGALGAAQS